VAKPDAKVASNKQAATTLDVSDDTLKTSPLTSETLPELTSNDSKVDKPLPQILTPRVKTLRQIEPAKVEYIEVLRSLDATPRVPTGALGEGELAISIPKEKSTPRTVTSTELAAATLSEATPATTMESASSNDYTAIGSQEADTPEQMPGAEAPAANPLDYFTESLLSLQQSETDIPLGESLAAGEIILADSESPAPPICIEVAEGLQNLEPARQEAATILVVHIMKSAQQIRQLREVGIAIPEAITKVQQKLVELCIELFVMLGIEYTPEDVEQFVRSILQIPYWQAAATAKLHQIPDNAGTREHKHGLALFIPSAWPEEWLRLRALLGSFALHVGGKINLALVDSAV
jgi:hypothetical protein